MSADVEAAERSLGRYRLLGEIGAGAMGTVFAAYDPELDRRVAIKLLTSDVDRQARLLIEARAMARLDHPNVVAVHDFGEHDGRLFLAMDLVDGCSLRAWLSAERRSWREVAAAFAQAARGLAAAHAARVVHRDFKPENVLVDNEGRVRVTDFGIARHEHASMQERTEPGDASATPVGGVVGTPAYLAPELIEGDPATPASDQFAFCISLWEALFGRRPFVGDDVVSVAAAILTCRIPPPPAGRSVPTWLRRLVERGLARAPEDRWASMSDLADALAKDPTLRRRRAALVLVGAVVVGGGAALTSRWVATACGDGSEQLASAWGDEHRLRIETALRDAAPVYGEALHANVQESLDAYAAEWSGGFESSCHATRRGEQSDALHDVRRACLDERLAALRSAVRVLQEAEPQTAEHAMDVVANLPAISACADLERMRARVPPPADHETAQIVDTLRGRLADARAQESAGLYARALELAEDIVLEAERTDFEPVVAEAEYQRGSLRERAGDYAGAEVAMMRAYTLAGAAGHDDVAAAAAMDLVFVTGFRMAEHKAGDTWAASAQMLVERNGDPPEQRARLLDRLGPLLASKGDVEAAAAVFRELLALQRDRFGSEHVSVAQAHNSLGLSLHKAGLYDEARAELEQALAIRERILGPEHPVVGTTLENLGHVADAQGHPELAERLYRRALTTLRAALGDAHPEVASARINLGTVLELLERDDDARTEYLAALAVLEAEHGSSEQRVAIVLSNLGNLAERRGDYAEAIAFHQRSVALLERKLGSKHVETASSRYNLANALRAAGRNADALEAYRHALAEVEGALGPDHPNVAYMLTALGELLLESGEATEAADLLRRAVSIREHEEGYAPLLAHSRFTLAKALWESPPDRALALEMAAAAEGVLASEAGERAASLARRIREWRAARR